MELQLLVHVTDMAASIAWYQQLGGIVERGGPDDDWVLLRVGGAQVGLLAHPPNPEQGEESVELTFVVDDVDTLAAELAGTPAAPVGPVVDAGFFRQLQVRTPDGLLVKLNQFGGGPPRGPGAPDPVG